MVEQTQQLRQSISQQSIHHDSKRNLNQGDGGVREEDSEVFSVRQFSSNAQQSQDKRDNNLQDSRPSFGNTYVNNFIREEELANS